jgi:signal transduction histidine kinase
MRAVHGLTIRGALLLGFGLTLGLWLFTGYDMAHRIDVLEQDAAGVNARYMRVQDQLATVRSRALRGSVYVRDAGLEPEPPTIDGYRARLQAIQDDIDRARPVIDLSEDAQALNRRAFVEQQASLASVYAAAERQTWRRLGVALAASFGIALMATLYATRLESWMKRQRERDRQSTSDLQRLSAQLITAQEQERRTIARELHDEVGQILTALKVELSHARHTFHAQGVATAPLEAAQSMADGALHSIRDLSRLLHPPVLDDLGLPAAVEACARGFRHRHELRVELHIEGVADRLAPEVEAAAYRIVQEALTNVVRHAHASTCRVALERRDRMLLLRIEDDGRGFTNDDGQQPEARGLGLIGIRERVAQLRGVLSLTKSPEGGVRISVELPARSLPAPLAHSLT